MIPVKKTWPVNGKENLLLILRENDNELFVTQLDDQLGWSDATDSLKSAKILMARSNTLY